MSGIIIADCSACATSQKRQVALKLSISVCNVVFVQVVRTILTLASTVSTRSLRCLSYAFLIDFLSMVCLNWHVHGSLERTHNEIELSAPAAHCLAHSWMYVAVKPSCWPATSLPPTSYLRSFAPACKLKQVLICSLSIWSLISSTARFAGAQILHSQADKSLS